MRIRPSTLAICAAISLAGWEWSTSDRAPSYALAGESTPTTRPTHATESTASTEPGLPAERGAASDRVACPPELGPAEARLLVDARDGRLDDFPLLTAALIAAGIDDASRARDCEARLQTLAVEFRDSEDASLPLAERAGAMHQFLHQRVLSGQYDPHANNIDEVFRSGRFNCITASTLLLALADQCDVAAAAWESPAHVLVVIDPDGIAAAVEMTRREWRSELLPGAARRPYGQPAERSSAPVADRPGLSEGRLIGPTQLLATYYHNRGVERLAAHDYAAAVALNETALALDGQCAAARQNLLAAWNNWGLALAEAGQFTAALEKIDAGLAIAPDYEPLRENRVYIESRRGSRQRSPRSAARAVPFAPRFL